MNSRTGSRRTATRHTSRPRKAAAGSFAGMLAKLGLASSQLKAARKRR
jgi:hypothetical protein